METKGRKRDLVKAVMISCACEETDAIEYINSEVRNIRELMDLGDFRITDITDACMYLGLEADYSDLISEMVYQ